jgi:hypothetical protein
VLVEVRLHGTCDRARLIDLVENCTPFSEHKAGLVKIIGQNQRFLGVSNVIAWLRVRASFFGRESHHYDFELGTGMSRFFSEPKKNPAAELSIHGLEGEIKHGGNINNYYDSPHVGGVTPERSQQKDSSPG